jgi:hypothetical protein
VTFSNDHLDITILANQVNADLSFAQAVGQTDISIIEHQHQN